MTRALVFVHYDRDGRFDDHVIAALLSYRETASRLVVVSTGAVELPASLQTVVDTFIPRPNIGYDFCSWRAGIESLTAVGDFDELICVNDSVYGPLFDLKPVLTDRRLAGSDFWGMCLSQQGVRRRGRTACPHVQSWFFAMRKPILQSRAFARFWNAVVPLSSKEEIIDRYEIGLSEHFHQAGFKMSAIYDSRGERSATTSEVWPHLSGSEPARLWRFLRKACRRSLKNPAERFPERIIEKGVPFAKVGLFRVNHYGLNLRYVLNRISELSDYDTSLITNHLARISRGAKEHDFAAARISPTSKTLTGFPR